MVMLNKIPSENQEAFLAYIERDSRAMFMFRLVDSEGRAYAKFVPFGPERLAHQYFLTC